MHLVFRYSIACSCSSFAIEMQDRHYRYRNSADGSWEEGEASQEIVDRISNLQITSELISEDEEIVCMDGDSWSLDFEREGEIIHLSARNQFPGWLDDFVEILAEMDIPHVDILMG